MMPTFGLVGPVAPLYPLDPPLHAPRRVKPSRVWWGVGGGSDSFHVYYTLTVTTVFLYNYRHAIMICIYGYKILGLSPRYKLALLLVTESCK